MQQKPNQGKLSRRQFLWSAAVTSLSVGALPLLASCAPAAPGASSTTEGGAEAAPGSEQITLTMNMRAGGDQSEPAIYVRRPAKFMEDNPNIKIELVPIPGEEYDAKILTSASAGTVADVLFTSDVWTLHTRLSKLGVIAPVDDQLEAQGISKDEWLPAAVNTLTHEGVMYGLPKASQPGDAYLWLNNSLFEEAGIAIPEMSGSTPEDVTAWAEAIARGPEDDREINGSDALVVEILVSFGPSEPLFIVG